MLNPIQARPAWLSASPSSGHIEICSYPNRIGDAQVRYTKLDRGVLILTSKPAIAQGAEYQGELAWERVGRD